MAEFKVLETTGQTATIKSRWTKLITLKHAILQRARQCAMVTIPALLPPEGHTEQQALGTPWQGLGARGVNHLASKLMLAILPPNTPFFRMMLDDFSMEKFSQEPGAKAEIDKALNKIERAVMNWVETSKARVPIFEALRLLIATGNTLLYIPNTGGVKTYRLDQYCVKRDPLGNVIEIVILERCHPSTLPESVRDIAEKATKNHDETVDLYTRVLRNEGKWEVNQEVNDVSIPESKGIFDIDDCPYLALRWTAIASEDYGRGLAEEYLGDLISLEGLMQAIVEGSVAASKVLFLNNPNGTTNSTALSKAANGSFVAGNAADVTVLQMQKYADFKIAAETIDRIERRLSYAFLLNTSVQRQAERVTAEEIRFMIGELEDSLGGQYSILAQELQLPFVSRMMKQMRGLGKLPPIPKEIKPIITTGLEALGRGHDLNKLDMFIKQLQPLGEETVGAYLRVDNYITRVGTALGLDTDGLVNSQEEVQQLQQQSMIAQGMLGSAPGIAREVTKGVMNG